MGILEPGTNEINAASAVLEKATVYETYEQTARNALRAALETRKEPRGTAAEALLELTDAISDLLADIRTQNALEQLPGLRRYRIDLALVEARRHLQQMQLAETPPSG